jgi:hypothetical protein
VSPNSVRIPIHCGSRIIEICNEHSVRRYERAPNVIELVRSRKTGQIVRVFLQDEEADQFRSRTLTVPEVLCSEHSGPCFDAREHSRDGLAFLQELSTGSVWALSGVTGSEAIGA